MIMRRNILRVVSLGILVCLVTVATVAQTKPVPPSRPTEAGGETKDPISQEREEPKEDPKLPRIDLPEFVIVGVARFDPPDVQKSAIDEPGIYRRPAMSQPGARDVETLELGTRPKERFLQSIGRSFFGVATMSYGSFATPKAHAWVGQDLGDVQYAVEAQYQRTKGFQPNTDRSGGTFGAFGVMRLNSESRWLHGATLRGDGGLGSEKYRFYGSNDPSLTRTLGHFTFGSAFHSGETSPIGYRVSAEFDNFSVQDSSEKARENTFRLGVQGQTAIGKVGIQSGVIFTVASVGSTTDHTLSMTEIQLGTSRIWMGSFYINAAVGYYAGRGMGDQRISKVAPRASIGYWFAGMHTVSLMYESTIGFASLEHQVGRNPFLTAQAVLKHASTRFALEAALESDWSRWLSSRISVRNSQIDHFPLLRDSARTGVWQLRYTGLTKVTTARLEGFANISANDYFALVVEGNHAENSDTNGKIAYLPEGEASVLYSHRFSFGVSVSPKLQYTHNRPIASDSEGRLPGFLLASLGIEFSGIRSLTIFARADNILDKQYEVWQRYRGLPFTATFGVSYRW